MGSCNGHVTDVEEAKRAAIEASLKSVEVAKNQQADLLQKFQEIYDYFEPDSYDSQDHWFLGVPEGASELKQLVEHLKRFSIAMEQILREESADDGYRELHVYAKYQISQLIEYLQQLAILMNEDAVDENYPTLPEDLYTDSSRSARQTRDYLVIRDYGQLLDLIQRVLCDLG